MTKKILFIGDDRASITNLQKDFKRTHPDQDYKIESLTSTNPKEYQSLHLKIIKENPLAIFIDFSKYFQESLHLARLLIRTQKQPPFIVIGLHDFLTSQVQIKDAILSGVKFNFIKSSESLDVVFTLHNLLNPDRFKEHTFVTSPCNENVFVRSPSKAGYITTSYIHIESDIKYENGEELILHHFWEKEKIIHSKKMTVLSSGTSLMFYNFNYFIKLQFEFADKPIISDTDLPERRQELNDVYAHQLKSSKSSLKKWLVDNASRSLKKKVRVLVIDKELTLHQSTDRIDKYTYSIRCHPYLIHPKEELNRFQPQVVAYVMKPIARDAEGNILAEAKNPNATPENDLENLESFIQNIKSLFPEKLPFLVIFNSDTLKSADFQAKHKYPQLLCFPGSFSHDIIFKMANKLEDKITPEQEKIKETDPYTLFIKKHLDYSLTEIEEEISITQISETDIVFTSKKELPLHTCFRIKKPFEGYFTIMPHPKFSKFPQYYAVINGISELSKMDLRRFINSLFFKEKDAQKAAEIEAFNQLNQQKMNEKQELEKQRIEAEELAKKEAEKKKAEESSPPDSPPTQDQEPT